MQIHCFKSSKLSLLTFCGILTLSLSGSPGFATLSTKSSAARVPSSVKLTGQYAGKRVTQVCYMQTKLTKDRPEIHAVAGDYDNCSSTLIAPDKVLTAGHCSADIENTSVICSCGEDDHQKSVEYGISAKLVHPAYDDVNGNHRKFDAQILTLGKKSRNDCSPGKAAAPMPYLKSNEEIKRDIAAGSCYLAGWGLDMSQQIALHAVKLPRGSLINRYQVKDARLSPELSTIELITFFNEAYRSRLNREDQAKLDQAKEDGASKSALKDMFDAQLRNYDEVVGQMRGDPNRYNLIHIGDSGGALFCSDAQGVDRLAGIIHSDLQDVALTGSSAISTWLEQNGIVGR